MSQCVNPPITNQKMDDFIHQSTFQYINTFSAEVASFQNDNSANIDLSLQIILHIISCVSAIRDLMDDTQKSSKNPVSTNIFHPFLNGMLATLGKLIMDSFTLEIKNQDVTHFTCSYHILMKHTLRLFPEMIAKKHKQTGKTLLHHVAFKAKPGLLNDIIKTILSISPDAANVGDATGALALHWATRNENISSECIDTLVQANPHSPGCSDQKGYLPLHWAVNQDNPNPEIVRKLLKMYPEASMAVTTTGSLPIHYCVTRESPSPVVLKSLINANPDSLRKKCNEGYLPLHRYVHRAPIDGDIIRILISHFPEGLAEVTNRNQSPLHIALDFPIPDFHGINIMLNEESAVCGIQDVDGYFPLHLLLDCALPDYVTAQRILLSYPDAAKAKTKDGMYPLHLLVSTNDNPSLSFVTMLLEANPQAIDEEVRDIVPSVDGVALVDPESWSGEWVEKSWSPLTRAKERGLVELSKLLLQFPKDLQIGDTMGPPIPSTAINKSQATRNVPRQTPPRHFVELANTQQLLVPLRSTEENSPEVRDIKLQTRLSGMSQRPTSSPVMNLENIEEDRQDGNDPMIDNFVGNGGPQNSDNPSILTPPYNSISVRNVPMDSSTNMRAPPTGPIPNSILQAAESNAMRLSKAQYEFLKSGKINKKAIRTVASKSKVSNPLVPNEITGDISDTGDEGNPQKSRNVQHFSSQGSDSDDNQIAAPVKVKKSSTTSRTPANNEAPSSRSTGQSGQSKVFSSSKSKVHPSTNPIPQNRSLLMGNDPHDMV